MLRRTLETSEGNVLEYAITNHADPLMAQLRVRPDETLQQLLDIHRSYGVSVNFPITYRTHDPVTAEMVELGYYRHPREATHADIAEALSCSASVVGQHLRRIETTLVNSVVPATPASPSLAETNSR